MHLRSGINICSISFLRRGFSNTGIGCRYGADHQVSDIIKSHVLQSLTSLKKDYKRRQSMSGLATISLDRPELFPIYLPLQALQFLC